MSAATDACIYSLGGSALLKTGMKVTLSYGLLTTKFICILCAFWMSNITDIQLTRCIRGSDLCVCTFVSGLGKMMRNDCNACLVDFWTPDETLLKFDPLLEIFPEIRNMWC